MQRMLNQASNAAAKAKVTTFAIVYLRLVPCLGHAQSIDQPSAQRRRKRGPAR